MGVLKDMIDRDDYEGQRWQAVPAHLNLMNFCNDHDEKETDLPGMWIKNITENLKWLEQNKHRVVGSVHDLPSYEHKAIIIVGFSPIIKKQWKALKNVDDKFVIVAVNSSAKYLLDHGIKPHYVILVDGRQGKSWTIDLGKRAEDIVGIFSVSAAPEAMQKWPGKIMILPYKFRKISKLMKKIEDKWGEPVPAGGNGFNAAVAVFVTQTKAEIFLFAGNELSWKKHYYAIGKKTNDLVPHYFATDVNGERVKTLLPLYDYKVWLEHIMCLTFPKYVFFNCSEGIVGVDVDGEHLPFIYQKPLDAAIDLVKDALDFEKKGWKEKSELVYLDAYTNRGYHPTNSKNVWPALLKQIEPFKKGLDVGCGEGQGIKIAREKGFNVLGCDIIDLQKIWGENGIVQYCTQAPAHKMPYMDNEFDFILCSETMEHIPREGVDESLKEIIRVGSDRFIFTIALSPDNAYWEKGVTYHTTLEEPEWWLDKLKNVGLDIAVWGISELPKSLIVYAVKDNKKYISGDSNLFKNGKLAFEDEDVLFAQSAMEAA